MTEYVSIALVLVFVFVFGLWVNRARNKFRGEDFASPKRSVVPLLVCAASFSAATYFIQGAFSGLGLLASIASGVAFLMLLAPVEYFIVRRFFEHWLLFYRVDDIFFPYFSAGVSMAWIVGRIFVGD